MKTEEVYGRKISEAHRLGDLQVIGYNNPQGAWISYDISDLNGEKINRDSIFSLSKKICELSEEWSSFQRLNGFESLIFDNKIETKKFRSFISALSNSNKDHFLLGFQENDRNSMKYNSTLIQVIEDLHLASGKITPIVYLSQGYNWQGENDLFLFKATMSLASPLFLNINDEKNQRGPWIVDPKSSKSTGLLDNIILNIPRIVYETKNEDMFLEQIGTWTEIAVEGLEKKREFLENKIKKGELPASNSFIKTFDDFYCGIGVVGVNEAIQGLIGNNIATMRGKVIAYKILEKIHRTMREHEKETSHPFCITAEPSNGAAYRFFEIDRKRYVNLNNFNQPFYSSSTCLPVDYSDDLWDAIEHQKKLQTLYTGGSLFNIYLEKGISDVDGVKMLTRRIVEKTPLPCFAFSPTVNTPSSVGVERFERLGNWYKPVSGMAAGELEEVRLRRPYAVASGW